MVDDYSKLLISDTKSCLIFFIAMLVTSGIAFFKGFYKLEKEEKLDLKLSYILSVFIIYLFVSLIIAPLTLKFFTNSISKNNSVAYTVLLNFSLNILVVILLSIYCFIKNPKITYEIIKNKTSSSLISKDIMIGIFSWIIAYPIVTFIGYLLDILVLVFFKSHKLPDQLAIEFIKSTFSQPIYFILALFLIIIVAPIIEEFLFRGVLLNFLKVYLKRSLAIIISSIVFAFFHYSTSQKLSNLTILISLFTLSCFLGFLYEKQKSLIAPIFLHATFNAISIINLLIIKGS